MKSVAWKSEFRLKEEPVEIKTKEDLEFDERVRIMLSKEFQKRIDAQIKALYMSCEVCGEPVYVWKDKVFPVCAEHALERLKKFLLEND